MHINSYKEFIELNIYELQNVLLLNLRLSDLNQIILDKSNLFFNKLFKCNNLKNIFVTNTNILNDLNSNDLKNYNTFSNIIFVSKAFKPTMQITLKGKGKRPVISKPLFNRSFQEVPNKIFRELWDR